MGVFPQLPPELIELIVRRLHPIEVATSFRLVNMAAATQFRGPEHSVIRLSQPVPPHAFAAHWLAPGATRGLTYKQRKQLLCLTAASGVVANLEVAMRAVGLPLPPEAFEAAAASGSLAACQWLRERIPSHHSSEGQGSQLLGAGIQAAARAGHRPICEWLLRSWQPPASTGVEAAGAAMAGGHLELADWLLERFGWLVRSQPHQWQPFLIVSMLEGCDLAALECRAEGDYNHHLRFHLLVFKDKALAAAAGSPTPDWAAKVEWLQLEGWLQYPAERVAALPDGAEALTRLIWLRGRGCRFNQDVVLSAARAGNLAALRYLLAVVLRHLDVRPVEAACRGGHLTALRVLHAAGWGMGAWHAARCAAEAGHLHVVAWLVEALGEQAVQLDAWLFAAAAESGSVELMAWLRERGCPWDESALRRRAEADRAFAAACRNADLATLRCLRRLGVPWGSFRGRAGLAVTSVSAA
ncbi:hypothetical protein GPECTOR_20g461 [Gonium pectorale]|uniref:Uncharacterized protein n=1 Tax=Gonium pectorale TaxID=33097 RepID=A0A150GIS0_GONPE|nr:hypothetical protein GPECTOR_20g461 [Gonium pectorale]|eukprot:KXZ49605.1 hypothetical protein GPECTOR_20g461 [Gonium pectorale]